MSGPLRLVIFDVDGTLVDSQGHIIAAMQRAFEAVDLPLPPRAEVLSFVGLSLDRFFAALLPEQSVAVHQKMAQAYKAAYMSLRQEAGSVASSPLYPGAQELLVRLQAIPDVLLGVATGKSKRGLDKLIEGHGWEGLFVTRQVADFHPSKPHPAMILNAMAETGVDADDTVMIGDTSFDMEMAAAAGVHGIGVSWGYHGADKLGQARQIVEDFTALSAALERHWSVTA